VKKVYAVGDVAGQFAFTHMSEHTAKVAVTHALLKLPLKVDASHLPWVTYTDPELAHVGSTAAALEEAGRAVDIYKFPYQRVDRAITEGADIGEIRILATKWRGKILGASVLGSRAGELIGELALAMRHGITLREISDTIHPYPTYGLGVRRAADQWYARRQSARLTRLVQRVFGYRGPVHEHEPGRIV
jgi:pyruvate/2-oxoglutarate dehydrogenase complex dihydrolipoamide dehydrogenase (E3) component